LFFQSLPRLPEVKTRSIGGGILFASYPDSSRSGCSGVEEPLRSDFDIVPPGFV